MSIFRNSSTNNSGTSGVGNNSYTISAYNPGYAGTEKGRIVFVFHRTTTGVGQRAISRVTYGGVEMSYGGVHQINNGAQTLGISFIVNPPAGAQDIIFFSVGGTNFGITVGIVSYYSDSDYSFRIANNKTGIQASGTSLTTEITTLYDNSWSVGVSSSSASNQTIISGTYVNGSGNPSIFEVVDSNGVVPFNTLTGIGVTTPIANVIHQEMCTFVPIRRGLFLFLDT